MTMSRILHGIWYPFYVAGKVKEALMELFVEIAFTVFVGALYFAFTLFVFAVLVAGALFILRLIF